jgi:hypothetical protein
VCSRRGRRLKQNDEESEVIRIANRCFGICFLGMREDTCLPYIICLLMHRPITEYAISVGPRWLEISAGLSLLFVALPLSIVLSMRRLVLGPVIFISGVGVTVRTNDRAHMPRIVSGWENQREMKRPNHAMERTADPRHASCVRTCRATGRGPLIADVGLEDKE